MALSRCTTWDGVSMAVAMVHSGSGRSSGNGRTSPAAVPQEFFWWTSLGRFLTLPVFVLDAEGNLVYFNPAAEHLLGRESRRGRTAAPGGLGAALGADQHRGSSHPARAVTGHGGAVGRQPTH